MPAISGRQFSNGDTAVGVGLIVAIIAVFLPWYSASFNCGGVVGCAGFSTSSSVGALGDWPGWLFFLAVLVGLVLFIVRTFMSNVTIPDLPQTDSMIYVIIGVFSAVMAILWLLLHSSGVSGPGYSVGPSFGLFIGIIAAVVVAVGGYLKRADVQPVTRAYPTPGPTTFGGGPTPPPPPA